MADEATGKKQRKLNNLIIDVSFQTKIIVMVTGFIIMQSFLVTGYIHLLFTKNYEVFLTLVDSNSEVLYLAETFRNDVMVGLVSANIGFIVAALLMSIYFSHKLAGPNYAIKKAINSLLDGVDHHSISLRKGDEYHDLAHRINVLFADYHLIKKDEIEDDEI